MMRRFAEWARWQRACAPARGAYRHADHLEGLPSKGHKCCMARQKTTICLEPDLLRATKTLAASSGRHDYEVIEAALRSYMHSEEAAAGRRQLQELLDRWGQTGEGLDEAEALERSSREVRAARRERRVRR